MILFRKLKLPRLIYRTWPWKIAIFIAVPVLTITSVSLATYFIVDYNNKTKIKTSFNVQKLPVVSELSNKEVSELTEKDLREILIEQFNTNQAYHIITPKNSIIISIDSSLSSSIKGEITFNANFALSNNTNVNKRFTVSGFKQQLRPDPLAKKVTIDNEILNNVYPSSLAEHNDPNILDINNPNYSLLKEYIFNLFPNKPKTLKINDFFIESDIAINSDFTPINSWDGSITIKYYLNKNKFKYPEFSYSTTFYGFKKYDLLDLQPVNGAITINAPISFSSIIASNVSMDTLKDIIVKELIQNDNSIPLKPEDINIELNRYDNKNGIIHLKYLQISTYNPIKNYSNVQITGFKKVVPSLKSWIISNHNFKSLLANEIDSIKLKEIIYNNLIVPSSIKILPTDVIVNITNVDVANGIIKLIPNIRGYDSNPFITETNNVEVTITNFKVNRPRPLGSEYTVPKEYAVISPSELTDEDLQKIIYSFMVNVPNDLKYSDINITSKNAYDNSITITGNIPKYISSPYNFSVKIIGFN